MGGLSNRLLAAGIALVGLDGSPRTDFETPTPPAPVVASGMSPEVVEISDQRRAMFLQILEEAMPTQETQIDGQTYYLFSTEPPIISTRGTWDRTNSSASRASTPSATDSSPDDRSWDDALDSEWFVMTPEIF